MILSNPIIEQIKSRLPILDALNKYAGVAPTRKGNTCWCSCLKHQERTPSMQIFPDRNYYRCFSCNAYGDQIDLVSEALGIPLTDAIKLLVSDLGLKETVSQEERDRLEIEQVRRLRERQKLIDQQNSIKQEYRRLIAIEKQMCSFLMSIDSGLDLNRDEVIKSLQHKELIAYWIDILLNGKVDEQLAVIEASKNFDPFTDKSNRRSD